MATYSSNTTIKIGTTVSQRNFLGSTFSYTVPANSYLSVSNMAFTGGYTIVIDYPSPHSLTETYSTDQQFIPFRNFPAGTIISSSNGGVGEASFVGTLFQNTP